MKNARDTFQYENLDRDLPTLKPVERPCVLAGMLCGRLEILAFQSEHPDDDLCRKSAALSIRMMVDLLQRLSAALDDTASLLELREVHAAEGRQIRIAGQSWGSYCKAAMEIGHSYYSAIYEAADFLEYGEWLLKKQDSRGYEQLSATAIEARWPEISEAILGLPEVDFGELELGISSEHLSVRGKNPPPPTGTINQRMAEMWQRDKTLAEWSKKDWATSLNCSQTGVQETDIWAEIQTWRKAERLSRADSKAGRYE